MIYDLGDGIVISDGGRGYDVDGYDMGDGLGFSIGGLVRGIAKGVTAPVRAVVKVAPKVGRLALKVAPIALPIAGGVGGLLAGKAVSGLLKRVTTKRLPPPSVTPRSPDVVPPTIEQTATDAMQRAAERDKGMSRTDLRRRRSRERVVESVARTRNGNGKRSRLDQITDFAREQLPGLMPPSVAPPPDAAPAGAGPTITVGGGGDASGGGDVPPAEASASAGIMGLGGSAMLPLLLGAGLLVLGGRSKRR